MNESTEVCVDCCHTSWSHLGVVQLSLFLKFQSSVQLSYRWIRSQLHNPLAFPMVIVSRGFLTSLSKTCLCGQCLLLSMLSSWVTWSCTLWLTGHEFAFLWLQTIRWSPGCERGSHARNHWSVPVEDSLQAIAEDPELSKGTDARALVFQSWASFP